MNTLTTGNPFAPGNPGGLAPLVYPNFDEGIFPTKTGTGYTPQSPFITIDRSSRPPRVLNWSFGVQRELSRDLVVEATYVGNRGVWFTAPELDSTAYNSLKMSDLTKFGFDLNSAADRLLLFGDLTHRSILLTPISSSVVTARFPQFAFPNGVYAGFPRQSKLEPSPPAGPAVERRASLPGPPMGKTWYDSLQVKATKRYSHGLQIQGSFTWSHNMVLGTSAETQYFTPGTPLINDVYNINQNKQLSNLGAPLGDGDLRFPTRHRSLPGRARRPGCYRM